MSVATAIARFRDRQAAQFTQTANVHRPMGEPTYDPDTGLSTQAVDLLYAGLPCKITMDQPQGTDVQAGETEVRLVGLMVKFPIDTDVAMNDLVTILSSVYNPVDVGRQYRITDVDRREWQISRRCQIEEALVPMLWAEDGS